MANPPPDGIKPGWKVPVLRGWASGSDAEAEAYLAASNRLVELGGWDDQELAALLASVDAADSDLRLIAGYDDGEFAALLREVEPPPAARSDVDAIPSTPTEPVTKLGDVWLLGPHRLVCGDCTDLEVIAKAGGDTADLLLTDPPYCSGGFQEAGRSIGSVGTTATHKQIANDRLSTRGYMALLKAAVGRAGAPFAYIFTDWRMWVNLFDVAESSGFGVRNLIVWDKGTPGMGRGWRSQHEIIMWATKAAQPNSKHDAAHGNVIQSKRTGNDLHTTQKPVDLLEQLLRVAWFADTVYDPFAGSGTTLIACHTIGRTARLVELDPAYCDVICQRWYDHTGEAPTREGTGEAFPVVEAA